MRDQGGRENNIIILFVAIEGKELKLEKVSWCAW